MPDFEFEPGKSYVMPVHFGPMVPGWDGMTVHYERAVALVFSAPIARSAVSAYLPPGFTADDPAIFSVRYLQLSGCVGLAGGGYNVVSVEVSARFDGEEDHVEGDYPLVQWEGHTAPAIMGRELVGSPKIVADISDFSSFGGVKSWHVSENATRMAEGELSQLEKLGEEQAQEFSSQMQSRPWLAWKHIPTPDGTGTELSYPTSYSKRLNASQVWGGRGKVRFFDTSFEQTPENHRTSAALAKLPIPEEGEAMMVEGSLDLPIYEWRRLK
ncbi:MAG: acetoacetate decarboxylase family protein [bacterium]|nr:acetoacetate decarboxylase family protein [bacterium]